MVSPKRKVGLLGIGLDNRDGEVRITRGRNFHLVGGSHETHQEMQEKCVKFNEKLTRRGKEIEDLDRSELLELADECDMKLPARGRSARSDGSH